MTKQEIYEKSNAVEKVKLNKFSNELYLNLLKDGSRQKNAQKLCDYLTECFGIPNVNVVVTNTAQPHSTNYRGTLKSKLYGTYQHATRTITIYNTTAVQKKTVSIKTFADTLLHEFIHHYDFEVLKLGGSYHTAGFYKRISDLKNKLGG